MLLPDRLVDTLGAGLVVLMRRGLADMIRCCKEGGLTMSQLGALIHIERQPAQGVSDLGDSLGITHAATSQLLDGLVRKKLVSRAENPRDRRSRQLNLTDKGRDVLQACLKGNQSWLADLVARLTPQEQRVMFAAAKTFVARLEQLEAAAPFNA